MGDERPTFGSLFAGIGGIDLGLERAGWECRWQVEWDPFCQRVLAKHWPDVPRYGDITAVDWGTVEPVELLAGGFPCQPVSVAGKRRGQDDDRWLWPEFVRAIRSVGPRYVLVENVPGLLVRGMGDVQRDLAALGYWRRWDVLAAADVGAPHLRERVWIIASRTELPRPLADSEGVSGALRAAPVQRPRRPSGGSVAVADPEGEGLEGWALGGDPRSSLTGPGEGGRTVADHWSTEPDVGRVAHGVPARVDRLRSLGNAVVPQVVEVIGGRLMEAES